MILLLHTTASSSIPLFRSANMSRRFRPSTSSAAAKSNVTQARETSTPTSRDAYTVDKLNDLARDPKRISCFAKLIARSKSAKRFEEESLDIKKESKKQAWAPKSRRNLSSASTKFQRHGKTDAVVDFSFHDGKKASERRPTKDFGRVHKC